MFTHDMCQDMKALKRHIKAKCRRDPTKSGLKTSQPAAVFFFFFFKPTNAFITISLLCNSSMTAVDGMRVLN